MSQVRWFHIKRRIHLMLFIIFAILTIGLISGCSNLTTKTDSSGGVLSLQDVEFSEESVMLQGDWEFYWQQFLQPINFHENNSLRTKHLITLPGSWNGYIWEGESLNGDGYATFRLILNIRDQDVGKRLALKMPTIFHSYKLWIDGELLAKVGEVGTNKHLTRPSLATKLVHFQPRSEHIELVMQVANFHHSRGGITKHIELGNSEELTLKRNLKIAFEMFVTASLFMIGLYHLFLYRHRRKDKAPLYFGIFSVMWSGRSLIVGDIILTQWFPNFPWGLQLKIEYFVLYFGTWIFTMYFHHLFKQTSPRWLLVTSGAIATIFSMLIVIFPAKIYTQTLLVYEAIIVLHIMYFIYPLFKAVKRREEGSIVFLIVAILVAFALLNDFLYYNEWLLIANTSAFGLFVFTCAQMYLLSARFTKAEANEEKIARELREINENLEHIVTERTQELTEANRKLQQAYDQLLRSEEGRKKLLSYITHDLKAPLATMMGYVEAVQDNINPEKNSIYLKYVYEKIIWLNRMIEDLSFLSHLETNQVTLDMQSLPIEAYVKGLWQKYEPVIQDAGLKSRFEMEPFHHNESNRWTLQVRADPLRIEQMLSNLLSNAMKFTPVDGTITLSLDYQNLAGTWYAVIHLADTGIGIAPDHLDHIFKRKYKKYPPEFNQDSVGSGLGLAITKEIVDLHKGKIWADSSGKEGSVFFIALPVIKKENAQKGNDRDEK